MTIFNKISFGWKLPIPIINGMDIGLDISRIVTCLQGIEEIFISLCGVFPRAVEDQASLVASPTTLLSGNSRRFYITAAVNLSYGDIITLENVAGVLKATKANAVDNTKPADGFCSTIAGIPSGQIGEVQLGSGVISFTTPLVIATRYYLSAVAAGAIVTTPAVAAGNIEQYLGIAIDIKNFWFNSGYWIQH